jgi:hypothetical protein
MDKNDKITPLFYHLNIAYDPIIPRLASTYLKKKTKNRYTKTRLQGTRTIIKPTTTRDTHYN